MSDTRKVRFLCDVDGIIADFVKAAIKVMTGLSGKPIGEDRIMNWEVTEVLEDPNHREEAKASFERAGFCETFETYDGSQGAIRLLNEATQFYFVTSPMTRNPGWYNERFAWLVKHFEVEPRQVNFVADKFIVKGDFLLDDSDKNVVSWLDHHPDGHGLLWDRPWNRACKDPRVVRVHSWAEVVDLVDKFHQSLKY